MTMMNFADLTSRHHTRRAGPSRSPFDSAMQTRDRKTRRGASGVLSLAGGERLDIARIERQSLLDLCGPERC